MGGTLSFGQLLYTFWRSRGQSEGAGAENSLRRKLPRQKGGKQC